MPYSVVVYSKAPPKEMALGGFGLKPKTSGGLRAWREIQTSNNKQEKLLLF